MGVQVAGRDHTAKLSTGDQVKLGIGAAFGVLCLLAGVYVLWAQSNGVSAAVTVVECHTIPAKYHSEECSGQWLDAGSPRSVWIESSGTPRVGAVETMSIHGGKAYAASIRLPAELFGGGALILVICGYAAAALHRRGASGAGSPSPA